MSEKICSVCGKSNPEEAELCQFCGAGFDQNAAEIPGETPSEKTGASVMTDLLAGLAHLNDEEDDVPSWLKDLQSNMPASPEAEPSSTPGQEPAPEAPAQEQPLSSEYESLAGEMGGFESEEIPEPFERAAGEAPDWLNALKAEDEDRAALPAGVTPPDAGQPQPGSVDVPDWLAALTGATSTQNEPELPVQPVEDDTPDWISSFRSTPLTGEPSKESGTAASGKVEVPDWLSSIGSDESQTSEAAPVEGKPASELPSWLADLQKPASPLEETPGEAAAPVDETPAALPSGDLPSWLADLQNPVSPLEETPGEAAAPEEETPAALPSGDLPSWLADLQNPVSPLEETPGEAAAPEEETPAALPAADLPSWLADLQKPVSPLEETPGEVAAPGEESPAAFPAGDLPSWLTDLQNPEAAGEGGTPALDEASAQPAGDLPPAPAVPSGVPADSDLPAWMIEALNAGAGEQPGPIQQPEQAGPFDTSSELPAEAPAAAVPVEEGLLAPETETPAAYEAGEAPVIQSSMEEQASPELAGPVEKIVEPGSQMETNLPLPAEAEKEPGISVPEEQQNIDSILAMDTPEWLSGFTAGEPAPASPPAAETASPTEELPAAELPSWLQVLRPAESSLEAPGETTEDQNIEVLGPLAGLSSVLPTQPKESTGGYSLNASAGRLLINDTQQTQAELLEKLLNSENNSQAFSRPRVTILSQPLRWIIAAVLLAAVLTAAILGSGIFPSPAAPAESSQIGVFAKTISGLPDGAPVLVVMDYQPGFAGELESAGGPVLAQLMGKDARLAFLSSSPLGGLMAERLVKKYASVHNYAAGSQYVNLGYLPGGASGIKAFAEQPRSVLGQDALLGNLWDSPVLQAVTINSQTSLNNFAALIVMTDNPDTGRLWIEQTQPSLGAVPLLMIVSAQAGPMLQPYYDSNQVKGLLSGLEGGLLYESAQGTPGQARQYWGGFGAALLAAEALILIGGVWSVISGLRARRAAVEQDEA